MDAVRRGDHLYLGGYFLGLPKLDLCAAGHSNCILDERVGVDAYNAYRSVGGYGAGVSAARIWPLHQFAFVVCRGVLYFLCVDHDRDLFSAGVEPGRPSRGGLRKQLSVCWLPGRDHRISGSTPCLRNAVG